MSTHTACRELDKNSCPLNIGESQYQNSFPEELQNESDFRVQKLCGVTLSKMSRRVKNTSFHFIFLIFIFLIFLFPYFFHTPFLSDCLSLRFPFLPLFQGSEAIPLPNFLQQNFRIKILCCKFWQFIMYFLISINRPHFFHRSHLSLSVSSLVFIIPTEITGYFFGLPLLFSIIRINKMMTPSSVCKLIIQGFLYFVFLQYVLEQKLYSL